METPACSTETMETVTPKKTPPYRESKETPTSYTETMETVDPPNPLPILQRQWGPPSSSTATMESVKPPKPLPILQRHWGPPPSLHSSIPMPDIASGLKRVPENTIPTLYGGDFVH
ncbi:hypothetical protein GDO81_007124 [Engystomops pustulosus]|uniref:Uncharacterized protein n=1 Tax=Engystomops pustulosus TaxID=76066 RepID=A0AAV7C601_ENGPU|nr:hypothetical protein GDO81_007124 [Engystomops pustulosus]